MKKLVSTVILSLLLLSGVALADKASAARARADAAAKVYAALEMQYAKGLSQLEPLVTWSLRWFEAERDAAAKPADAKAAADAHLARLQTLAAQVAKMYQAGVVGPSDKLIMDYWLADAQYQQLK